jgi:hypothetical protein
MRSIPKMPETGAVPKRGKRRPIKKKRKTILQKGKMSDEIDDLLGLSSSPSVGDALKSVQPMRKVRVKRKAPKYPRKWTTNQDYEIFSEGIVLSKSPDKLAGKLGPQCLFLFRHVTDSEGDDVVGFGEDRDRPLWIGVLKPHNYPEGMYYSPTQDQEKLIYANRPVKNMPKEFHLENGSPYWVDSYYHKKGRERKNKTRHTKKISAKRKRARLVGGKGEVTISGGLPLDDKTFFNPPNNVMKTLKKGDWFEGRKVARRTMATSNLAKNVPSNATVLLKAMLSGSVVTVEEGDAQPKKKKPKNYRQESGAKSLGVDFIAPRWSGPIPLEEMPIEMIEYINCQQGYVKAGSRGHASDAMWSMFRDYSLTKVPAQRVANSSAGDLLYSYHNFVKNRDLA